MPRRDSDGPLRHYGLLILLCLAILHGSARQPPGQSAPASANQKSGCLGSGCHAAPAAGRTPIHIPFLEEQCLACHIEHADQGDDPPMLMRPGGDALCLDCHGDLPQLAAGDLEHPPGDEACLDCHAPHQSPVRGLLRDNEELGRCAACHADFLEKSASMPHSHGFFNPESDCGSCHFAHHEGEGPYLRPDVDETCMTCHDLPIRMEDGRELPNIARQIRTMPNVHEALLEDNGACPSCHTPHGAVQPSLLKAGYPAGNYAEGGIERFELCWGCHDPALATSSWPVPETQFRDGKENLHARHLTNLRRGRACHLCHAPHASERPHLMRESMRMGSWEGALIFESLPEGGRCTTPCHRPVSYARTPLPADGAAE